MRWRRGAARDVPLLIGTTRDEYALWGAMAPTWRMESDETMVARLEAELGPLHPRERQHYLAGKSGPALFDAVSELATDRLFWAPTLKVVQRRLPAAPVFRYRFDWSSVAFGGALKACHALEIPFCL